MSRIIPARAGFTRPRRPPQPGRPDHPRSRGVYSPGPWAPASSRGSSPLARGLPCGSDEAGDDAGIIPARAGFTPARSQSASRVRDHPRSRGVYSAASATPWPTPGSSPLARGLRRASAASTTEAGIIPARAGFTPAPPAPIESSWDHPRSRGVYIGAFTILGDGIGSSPLARGLPGASPPARGIWVDHPRSRGVYNVLYRGRVIGAGSSPLARGLLRGVLRVLRRRGIIPARAGFTSVLFPTVATIRDHPRSRGVYARPAPVRARDPGSSPLARGLRKLQRTR